MYLRTPFVIRINALASINKTKDVFLEIHIFQNKYMVTSYFPRQGHPESKIYDDEE